MSLLSLSHLHLSLPFLPIFFLLTFSVFLSFLFALRYFSPPHPFFSSDCHNRAGQPKLPPPTFFPPQFFTPIFPSVTCTPCSMCRHVLPTLLSCAGQLSATVRRLPHTPPAVTPEDRRLKNARFPRLTLLLPCCLSAAAPPSPRAWWSLCAGAPTRGAVCVTWLSPPPPS